MNNKKLLYFKNINLDISNYKILQKNFKIILIKNLKQTSKLNKKILDEIFVIYCDPNFFFSKKFLKKFKNLKTLISSTTSVGFIDEEYCRTKKIKIISLEKQQKFLKSITPTAEHVFGLILMISRNYLAAIKSVNQGKFNRKPFGGFGMLSKLKIGIIGYGRLGKLVKKIAKGFGMIVYKCDIKQKNFKKALNHLVSNSDFISLHIPSEKNYEFFSKKNIGKIKRPFFLINTSRGEIVDEKYIIEQLKLKNILGYATDVLKNEFSHNFKLKKNEIFKNKNRYNIVITPHIGGSTKDAWKLTEYQVIKKLIKKI
jgi:lactate dehydrogenase-like 2-hydroxyacid dehydrogenase